MVDGNQKTDDADSAHVSGFLKRDMQFVTLRDGGFSNVVNLSSNGLSQSELSVLSKGSFILPST